MKKIIRYKENPKHPGIYDITIEKIDWCIITGNWEYRTKRLGCTDWDLSLTSREFKLLKDMVKNETKALLYIKSSNSIYNILSNTVTVLKYGVELVYDKDKELSVEINPIYTLPADILYNYWNVKW